MLGASDRVAGNEDGLRRKHGENLTDHRRLDRADLGDDGTFTKMRSHGFHRIGGGANRHGNEHKLGVLHRLRRGVGNGIAEAELLAAVVHLRGGVVADDAPGEPARLDAAGDRGADQPKPDDDNGVEHWLGHCRFVPVASMKALSASSTARFSSSVPMVMRNASGKPYSSTRRKLIRRDWRNVSASTAE